MGETCYLRGGEAGGELEHRYGDHVHLIRDPLALTWLARLCHPSCVQPEINRLTTQLYRGLVREMLNRQFPRRVVKSETRMRQFTERGYYEGQILDPAVEVTSVDIARAGILPSMVCFEALCEVLDPTRVRQDHILMNRTTNDQHQVTGAGMYGKKIAGPVKADRNPKGTPPRSRPDETPPFRRLRPAGPSGDRAIASLRRLII
ncbi:MAG: hypothetical protein FJ100_22755, partial [Deltaproteobacteria bacterium]|nr:hypothetical protein [Deltaproteobacteria bacterium]